MLINKRNLTNVIEGFHVTSSPSCWWTKTKDLSLASFFVHQKSYISLLILVSLEVGELVVQLFLALCFLKPGYFFIPEQ